MLPTHHKKSNMVFDGMRVGGGRCPPLIVTMLLVACFILVCNWWNLSTANETMLNQIEHVQDQLKDSIAERDVCLVNKIHIEERNRNSEKDIAALHVRLQTLADGQKGLEDSLENCHVELDSLKKLQETQKETLEARRQNVDSLASQLEVKKDEVTRLQGELDQLKTELDHLKVTCKGNSTQKTKLDIVATSLNHKDDNKDDQAAEVLSDPYDEATASEVNEELENNKEALKL